MTNGRMDGGNEMGIAREAKEIVLSKLQLGTLKL